MDERPAEAYWRWVQSLPHWDAVAAAIPIDVIVAGPDAQDAWVVANWPSPGRGA